MGWSNYLRPTYLIQDVKASSPCSKCQHRGESVWELSGSYVNRHKIGWAQKVFLSARTCVDNREVALDPETLNLRQFVAIVRLEVALRVRLSVWAV